MLPYFEQPVLTLGPLHIYAFGVLVAIGVLVGLHLAKRGAPSFGVDVGRLNEFVMWILVPGFLSAHLLDALWYHPREVAADPGSLLALGGLSSFGGFLGALLGALAWRARRRERLLPYVDLTLSVFPIAWSFGRAGCTLAHDHPGIHTSAGNVLAFAYPDGPRWDLGLLEMLFSIALSIVVVRAWRSPRPLGFYVALTASAYAPVRFALDFLRAEAAEGGDARYGGLTPGQWASLALFATGLWFAWQVREEEGRSRRAGASAPPAPAALGAPRAAAR